MSVSRASMKCDFIGHEVFTVDEAGFKGLKNGRFFVVNFFSVAAGPR